MNIMADVFSKWKIKLPFKNNIGGEYKWNTWDHPAVEMTKMHEVAYNSIIQDFRKYENFNQDLLSAYPRMHACNAILTEQGSVITG